MDPITAIRPPLVRPAGGGSDDALGPVRGGSGFGQMIGDAIKQLDQVQKQADAAANQVAAGDGPDLHNAMISVEEASLSFQLALQVRNKIVEGYQEIMRMSV